MGSEPPQNVVQRDLSVIFGLFLNGLSIDDLAVDVRPLSQRAKAWKNAPHCVRQEARGDCHVRAERMAISALGTTLRTLGRIEA